MMEMQPGLKSRLFWALVCEHSEILNPDSSTNFLGSMDKFFYFCELRFLTHEMDMIILTSEYSKENKK